MQRQPEPQPVEMLDPGRLGQRLDIRLRRTSSGERAAASFGGVAIASGDRKDRQSIAHEFEDLAVVVEDRRHLTIEITIEQTNPRRELEPPAMPEMFRKSRAFVPRY